MKARTGTVKAFTYILKRSKIQTSSELKHKAEMSRADYCHENPVRSYDLIFVFIMEFISFFHSYGSCVFKMKICDYALKKWSAILVRKPLVGKYNMALG